MTYVQALPSVEGFYSKIDHLDKHANHLLIVFSGTPGMGKSTVAKALAKRFEAPRLSTDEVRAYLQEKSSENSRYRESIEVPYFFFQIVSNVLKKRYRMVILDLSIDQGKGNIEYELARRYGYRLFKVRMLTPYGQVKERLRKRKDSPSSENFGQTLPTYIKLYEASRHADYDDHFDNSDGNFERSMEELASKVRLLL